MMNCHRQRGITTVEFAIVGLVLFIMIFGVIEVARGYYVYTMLGDVARRGARLAAVCPVNDPAVPQMAIYNASGNTAESGLVKGLVPANIAIDYLDANGTIVTTPGDPANFSRIRFVRSRVVGFEHALIVPFVSGVSSITMPEFSSILPRESLGVPREGVITSC
jgi:Flp pilus assembly protein TadG